MVTMYSITFVCSLVENAGLNTRKYTFSFLDCT